MHLTYRNGKLRPVLLNYGSLRSQLHKASEGIRRFALGMRFKGLANGYKRQYHCRRFEIKIIHISHGSLRAVADLSRRHCKKRPCAVKEGRRRPHCDECVHVRGTVDQRPEAAYEEFLIYHHDNGGKQ